MNDYDNTKDNNDSIYEDENGNDNTEDDDVSHNLFFFLKCQNNVF